jgi:probable HAF family extracellular repeat protein
LLGFALILISCAPPQKAPQQRAPEQTSAPDRYELIALGEIETRAREDLGTFPTDISDDSVVVGFSWGRAFRWTEAGGMEDLGARLGAPESQADGVSAAGHVIGWRGDRETGLAAYLWTEDGGAIDLPTLEGFHPEAHAVNDSGVVAGAVAAEGLWRAALWSNGEISNPDFLGILNDVNDEGAFAGELHGPGGPWPIVWARGKGFEKIGSTTETENGRALAINAAGDVVGESDVPNPEGPAGARAFLWTREGGMRDLGGLSLFAGSKPVKIGASDINDHRIVVGQATDWTVARAFVWDEKNGMRDLNDLIAPPEAATGSRPTASPVLTDAMAINNKGEIVAYSYDAPSGRHDAYLLRPVE